MKKLKFLLVLFAVLCSATSFAQDITFVPQQTTIVDTMGKEFVFYIDVTNISQQEQIVFVKRTVNNLPSGWTSSLCFDACFPDFIDSITTESFFGSSPMQPGEHREMSVHVFTTNIVSTGNVEIEAGTFRHPNDRITVDFTATTFDPTTGVEDEYFIDNYFLSQNYPNPFNPSTEINFGLKESGNVSLKLFDVLGNEVAELVNEYRAGGNHTISLDASSLSSGIYFYTISVNDFVQTKKMILEK